MAAVNRDGYSSAQSTSITIGLPSAIANSEPTATQIAIYFSEPLTTTPATTLSNYSVSGETVSGVVISRHNTEVYLTLSAAMTLNSSYTVTMKNLTTVSGDQLPATDTYTFKYALPAWTATMYQANWGTLGSLTDATSVVQAVADQSWSQAFTPATLNFTTDNSTGLGHFTNDTLMPTQTSLSEDLQNIVIAASAAVYVPAAGNYTFNASSDDGFGLTIPGVTFTTLTNATNSAGSDQLQYNAGRGTADTLGVAAFPAAGYYPLSVLYFNGGGPGSLELSAAAGSYTAWTSAFELVGDSTDGGLALGNPITDTTPPAAPANLRAAVTGSNNQITLNWGPVQDLTSGIDHYAIYRDGSLYATSSTTSYTDTSGISAQTPHSYQVAAVNYDGVAGAESLAVSISAVGIASISALTTTSVLVNFTEPVDLTTAQTATNYLISGISIASATREPNDYSVLLALSALGTGSHTLTVSNVKTWSGSSLPTLTSPSFAYSSGGSYVAPPFTVAVNSLTTNDPTPAIGGTVSDLAASLSVRVNGNWYAVANNNGAWALPEGDISTLASGTYDVAVRGVNTSGQVAYDSTLNELTVNATPPTAALQSVAAQTAPISSLSITFSKPVYGFSAQNLQFTLNGIGLPLEGTTLTTSDDENWTLGNLSAITGTSGTYNLTLSAAGWDVTDTSGNTLATGATSSWTRVAPTVQSINTAGSTITNASSVQYIVTFNESVTNVLAADFTLATSGAAGTIGTVTGSGSTYTVTVNNVSGNGTLGLNLANNGSIIDVSGNPLGNSLTGQLYTIDTTAPTISIGSPSAAYATGGPITYTVTYADANFNASTLAAGNVTLNKTGTASGTVAVSGTGLTRTVTISSISGDGSLGISIAAGTASDLAGNLAPAAGPSTTFVVDNTAPAISIGSPSVAYATGGPVTYTVTYADTNFNASTLAAGNVTLNKTGTATGTVAVNGTGLTRTVTVSSISGNGSLGISIAAGTASDLAGNLAPAAGPSTTFIVDNTAPTISIASPSGSYAAGGPITYTVTYADANFNASTLAAGNVTLNKTGTATGTVAVSGTGLTRTVTISSISGNGSLGISIAAGTASDLAGNLAPAAGPSTTFVVDNTSPTISIGAPSATLTAAGPITYTVAYADANFNTSTLAASNITLNKTGTASGTVGVAGSGLTRTVTISSITGNGTLGVSIAAGTASDLAGNLAPAAGPSTTFAVDNSPPTVATPASATPGSVTGTTTALSVLGADLWLGEGSLTYTWAATVLPSGAAAPVFSVNGSNAAKNSTATFSKAGSYTFQATITDVDGLSANSTVNVTVNQTLNGVAVSPPVANLTAAGTQQFTAASVDQFGNPMPSQPSWTWSLIGAGSLSAGGLYLPPYAAGSATVQATSGALTNTATVNFAGQAVWSSAVNSSWNTAGNWRDSITGNVIAAPGVRGIAGDTVVFNSSAAGTVTLDGATPSLAGITFSGGNSQTIAQGSGGTLDLNNGANAASITVGGGSAGNPGPAISAPLVLGSSLSVAPASGNTLTVSGAISGAGAGLTLNGPGTLVLGGVDTCTGGTTVAAGVLQVGGAPGTPGPATLGPGTTSLTVNGGTLAVNPGGVVNVSSLNVSSGGADLNGGSIRTSTISGLPLTFNLGTLEYTGNLTVSASDWLQSTLGSGHPLGFAQQLKVDGTTTLNAALALSGGTFSTGVLVNPSLLTFTGGAFDLTTGNLTIGSGGLFGSALTLSSGMSVNVSNNASIAAGASLSMQGGTFSAAALTNSGTIGGSGQINAPLTNAAGGLVRALTSDHPVFSGASNVNQGQVQLSGGAVEFAGALTNSSGGLITGNGRLIVSGGLSNSGSMTLSGVTNIVGAVTNAAGGLVNATGATTFWGSVANSGTIRTENGSFTVFYGPVSDSGAFTGPGTASIESNLAITISGGQQAIDSPLALAENLVVSGSGTLVFHSSSSITESGNSISLTMNGVGGTLILSGKDSYTGGTNVDAGTLVVTSPSAIADGTSLTIGAGGTFIFDPSSSDSTAVSDATFAATSSDTSALTAAPLAANVVFAGPLQFAPTAVARPASGSAASAASASVSNSAADSPVLSSATAATPAVALPLPASAPGPRTEKPGKLVPAGALGTPVANRLVWSSIATKAACDFAWLGQTANHSDNSDQRRKKDVAILALNAVFAQYGQ